MWAHDAALLSGLVSLSPRLIGGHIVTSAGRTPDLKVTACLSVLSTQPREVAPQPCTAVSATGNRRQTLIRMTPGHPMIPVRRSAPWTCRQDERDITGGQTQGTQ